MKFTLAWLAEHLETRAGVREIVDRLTELGLEVEEVIDRARDLNPFTVARVVDAHPHPDADKLTLCTVDTGARSVQVVCGAPNARTGMKGVFAAPGTTLPCTGMVLKKARIRGQDSHGMLCSEREMGLGEDHAGIIELPEDAAVGEPFARSLGLDDPVIDVAVTPNRPDCLGARGIARDLAAAGLGTLKPLVNEAVDGGFTSPVGVRLAPTPGAENACPLFVGRYLRGVTNGPSPRWLADRLRAVGLRPISALVDMTNFITLDLGRPLHVFDADTLAGSIHVRLSRAGETLAALNDKDYTLDDEMTVIADDDGVLGLGGVIGGTSSGCTEATRNVFIEAALFDPVRTAMTGRKLNIESDARYRFERGVDPAFVYEGMEAGTRLALALCGGEPSALVAAGAEPDWRRDIALRPSRIHHLGGIDLPEDDTVRLLGALGFGVTTEAEALRVAVPSWRGDIEGEADLVEEVVRLHGYGHVPEVALTRRDAVARPIVSGTARRRGHARRALAERGLVEAVTWSFLPAAQADLFGGASDHLRLANPISADLDAMRPSLLPNLIAAAGRNIDRGARDVALFEVGPVYADDTPQGQSTAAAAVRSGEAAPRHWARGARNVDAFDAKADALAALEAYGAPVSSLEVGRGAPAWFHPGRSGVLKLGPKTSLAAFGEVHPAVLRAIDVKGPLVGFEAFLDSVPAGRARAGHTRPRLDVVYLPVVERDFAFVLDEGIAAAAVIRAVKGADKALVREVDVFDVYRGEGIGVGKKSIALSVRLEPSERTLTDSDIDAVAQKIVAAVAKATGGSLRG